MKRRCLALGFFLVVAAVAPAVVARAWSAPKHILFLHSYGRNYKPWGEYAKALREELDRFQTRWPLVIDDFSVATARADNEQAEARLADYLNALFARPPDLTVTFGAPAASFAQRYRERLFPATPMLLAAVEERRVRQLALTASDTVLAVRINIPVLFSNILQLLPDTRTMAVVVGASPNEQFWVGEIQKELEPLKDRLQPLFLNDLPFEDILKRVENLPANSVIFWVQPQVDAAGAVHEGDSALKGLYRHANAPIFSYDDSFFGEGIVGGPMTSVSDSARAASEIAARLLSGERPSDIKTATIEYGPPKYDWRTLQRWGISESALPSGSEIHFRDPSAWERYRWQALSAGSILALQAALISILLLERGRRRVAEVQSRQRMYELAHVNRVSTAGELTASIAHELSQPLGAILSNAEALQSMLQSPSPDLKEINEIAADIVRDDRRAADVIDHLRNILKKAPTALRDVDLNDVVREAIRFISISAVGRQANLTCSLSPVRFPIRGDRVQIGQVLLNLILNAIEAMPSRPGAEREVVVWTSMSGKFAEVAVADRGPGVDPAKLREIFEPFFTTKAQGMGMGLSIARTIIEAHGGLILAANREGGGAVFTFKLPLI